MKTKELGPVGGRAPKNFVCRSANSQFEPASYPVWAQDTKVILSGECGEDTAFTMLHEIVNGHVSASQGDDSYKGWMRSPVEG